MKKLPETIAYVRIMYLSFEIGLLKGMVNAGDFEWEFEWHFIKGKLLIRPSFGRALIQEPLGRFLEKSDYQLEMGGDYSFTIRGSF